MRPRFTILALLLSASTAHAGAWVQPEGSGMAIMQVGKFSGARYFDVDGSRKPQPRYTKWEAQPYLEYGITGRHTIGATGYLQRTEQRGEANTGIADPELFLRSRIWNDDDTVVSLQPLVKFPSAFVHPAGPRGGSRSVDSELSLLYGHNIDWFSNRDYLDIRLGYRHRTRGLAGQYRTDIALGLSPWERWQFIPALRTITAAEIDTNTTFTQNGEQNYDLLKAELTIMYRLGNGNWVQATMFDHVAGAQTGDGRGLSFGYAVRF